MDIAELERLARAATAGPWHPARELAGVWMTDPPLDDGTHWERAVAIPMTTHFAMPEVGRQESLTLWEAALQGQQQADARYIAAAHPATLLALLAERRALLGMLHEVEWSALVEQELYAACPICNGRQHYGGHAPDCRYAALMARCGEDEGGPAS